MRVLELVPCSNCLLKNVKDQLNVYHLEEVVFTWTARTLNSCLILTISSQVSL